MGNRHSHHGPTIHAYTRADVLADGTLVAVAPRRAAEAGLRVPVALTRAVWEDCVAWSAADSTRTGIPQDEDGRLWDVLWMARDTARRAAHADQVPLRLHRVSRTGRTRPQPVTLLLHIGPGDAGEPVITICFPDEV